MSAKPFTLLVVDEDPSTRQAFVTALAQQERFNVRQCSEGTTAVREVTSGAVDLVLLDLELPGALEGFQVLRLLRASEGGRHVPVVVLTDKDDRQTRLNALRLGADDFLTKPWDDEELLIRMQRYVSTKRHIDSLMEQTAELQRLSVTDGLTQLHNHRYFKERLAEEFRRAQRYDDPLSLVLVDLDHFKAVNDRFGHQVGDDVLKEVASCLLRNMRETDLLARYGGEEFAVLLPKTHLTGSLTVAERLWKDLGALRVGPQGLLRVTASLGISGFPSRAVQNGQQLFGTADEALYRAKSEGRNKICLYQPINLKAAGARSA